MTITILSIEPPFYVVGGNKINFISRGVYTYDTDEEELLNTINFDIYNYIEEGTYENLAGTTKNITYQGQAESGGFEFTIKFDIRLTDDYFLPYFKQFAFFNFFVRYTDETNNFPSNNNPKYFIIPINYSSANIVMTNNNIKTITTVYMNSNKSVFLPNKDLCSGMVFHFKLILAQNAYDFQIFPLIMAELPTAFTFSDTLPPFQCSIDNNTKVSLRGDGYKCISLVADGSNWRIVNYYGTALTRNLSSSIPGNTTVLTNPTKNITYFKWDISGNSSPNIHISSLIESDYKINFLTILNMYSTTNSADTFRIYFPYEKSVDRTSATGKYTYIELSITKHKIYSIFYSKDDSGYIILGTTNYDSVSVQDTVRTESYSLINRNVTFLSSVDQLSKYEFNTTTSELQNSARIHILKIPQYDIQANSYQFYTPLTGNANIIFNNSNSTMIQLAGLETATRAKALWLSVRNQTAGNTTIILPIHYYNGEYFNI